MMDVEGEASDAFAAEEPRNGGSVQVAGALLGDRYRIVRRIGEGGMADVFEVEHLRLAGMATEMCVTQTAIAARELEFKVTVIPGACACVDERLERIALEYLRDVVGVRLEP